MVALTKTLQDAAYVAVGLGVIGFQKAQVRRHELQKQFDGTRKDLTSQVETYRDKLGELAEKFEPVVKNAVRQVRPTA